MLVLRRSVESATPVRIAERGQDRVKIAAITLTAQPSEGWHLSGVQPWPQTVPIGTIEVDDQKLSFAHPPYSAGKNVSHPGCESTHGIVSPRSDRMAHSQSLRTPQKVPQALAALSDIVISGEKGQSER